GQIQARRTTGQIGGDMVAVASARHTMSTQQDIAFELMIGARAQADQALTVQAGGSLRLDTLQDHQRSASNGGDWSLSAGAGV
ncbi:hypothetical protein, partial [Bordetella avium]